MRKFDSEFLEEDLEELLSYGDKGFIIGWKVDDDGDRYYYILEIETPEKMYSYLYSRYEPLKADWDELSKRRKLKSQNNGI
jgi:hypothetical protein